MDELDLTRFIGDESPSTEHAEEKPPVESIGFVEESKVEKTCSNCGAKCGGLATAPSVCNEWVSKTVTSPWLMVASCGLGAVMANYWRKK